MKNNTCKTIEHFEPTDCGAYSNNRSIKEIRILTFNKNSNSGTLIVVDNDGNESNPTGFTLLEDQKTISFSY